MPAIVAAVFLLMFEVPHLQRIVTISREGISCDGAFMMFGGPIHWIAGMRRWNWRELKQVQLLRPREAGNVFDFGQRIVMPKHAGSKRLAVPSTIALNEVADCLHARGVDVLLSEWHPSA